MTLCLSLWNFPWSPFSVLIYIISFDKLSTNSTRKVTSHKRKFCFWSSKFISPAKTFAHIHCYLVYGIYALQKLANNGLLELYTGRMDSFGCFMRIGGTIISLRLLQLLEQCVSVLKSWNTNNPNVFCRSCLTAPLRGTCITTSLFTPPLHYQSPFFKKKMKKVYFDKIECPS